MDKKDVIKCIRYNHELCDLFEHCKEIVLYGAGNAGKEFFAEMPHDLKDKVVAFVVSNLSNCEENNIEGIKIISVDELEEKSKDFLILITIRKIDRYEVKKELHDRAFRNIHLLNWEALDFYKEYFGYLNKKSQKKLFETLQFCDLEYYSGNELYSKMLNLAKFVSTCNIEFKLSNMSFSWGSSGVLDYVLLRSLIYKYNLKSYFEIGTYIGDSLTCISDLVEVCYSLSVPESHPAHMKNWCKERHMNDYSGKLVKGDNIISFLNDSKKFQWDEFNDKIDLYFVDGDHSFQGVLIDSINIANRMDWENDFIVWHDCRSVFIYEDVVEAIKIALGEHYDNFYIFDSCMCGIYIPPKYRKDFVEVTQNDKLITYSVKISVNEEIE